MKLCSAALGRPGEGVEARLGAAGEPDRAFVGEGGRSAHGARDQRNEEDAQRAPTDVVGTAFRYLKYRPLSMNDRPELAPGRRRGADRVPPRARRPAPQHGARDRHHGRPRRHRRTWSRPCCRSATRRPPASSSARSGVIDASDNVDSITRDLNTIDALLTTDSVLGAAAERVPGETVESLRDKVASSVDPNANLIYVTGRDGDPEQAARIANAVASTFVAEQADDHAPPVRARPRRPPAGARPPARRGREPTRRSRRCASGSRSSA